LPTQSQVCLLDPSATMAERYHKSPSQNSTPVPPRFCGAQPVNTECKLRASVPSGFCQALYLGYCTNFPTSPIYLIYYQSVAQGSHPLEYPNPPGLCLRTFSRFACGKIFRDSYPPTCTFGIAASLLCSSSRIRFTSQDFRSTSARLLTLPHGPRSLTICNGFTRAFPTVNPQWRCGPVTRPVAPTFPRTAPASRTSSTFTPISERCP